MNTHDSIETPLMIDTPEPEEPVLVSTPRKPRLWSVLAIWFLAIVTGQLVARMAYIAVGIAVGFVMGVQGADPMMIQARFQELIQQPMPALLLALLPYQLGIGLIAMLAAWKSAEPTRQRLGLVPPSGRSWGRGRLLMLAAFAMSAAFTTLIGVTLWLGGPPADPISATIKEGSWWTITLVTVMLSTIPAIVEEILFRGYIQRRLLQRWSPAVAIMTTTLLFALTHNSLQQIIAVVPLGLITGILACRTNSVKPGMFVHAVYNAGVVGIGALANRLSPMLGDEMLGMLMIGLIVLMGLIGLPATISLLRRAHRSPAFVMAGSPISRMADLSLKSS